MRLGDVTLGLQHGHIVADRGGRDTEVVALDQRLRPDRLLGGDEVGDDRTQHLKATVVGTSHPDPPFQPDPFYGDHQPGPLLAPTPASRSGPHRRRASQRRAPPRAVPARIVAALANGALLLGPFRPASSPR